eukprot:3024589-Karenia_brevis.AAC.1
MDTGSCLFPKNGEAAASGDAGGDGGHAEHPLVCIGDGGEHTGDDGGHDDHTLVCGGDGGDHTGDDGGNAEHLLSIGDAVQPAELDQQMLSKCEVGYILKEKWIEPTLS